MTDRLYTSTTEIERARSLWEKAVLLAERTEGFYRIQLYQLHDIYLEVRGDTHHNQTVSVHSFSNTDGLEPYLNNISLEGLL